MMFIDDEPPQPQSHRLPWSLGFQWVSLAPLLASVLLHRGCLRCSIVAVCVAPSLAFVLLHRVPLSCAITHSLAILNLGLNGLGVEG